jgi:hypothetical protein
MKSNNDALSVKGDVILIKTDELGNSKKYEYKNLVVSVGKTFIASRMASNTSVVMSHMAIGNGAVAAAVSDTTLGTELGRVTLAVNGGSPSANTINYSANIGAGTGTGAITEAGVFNDSSAGTMLCRTVFPVVNKLAGDSIAISWTISIT